MKRLILSALLILLDGCSALQINRDYSARSQDGRIQYIIIHYTSEDLAGSLKILTQGEVSAHYLIADKPPTIYQLVDESRRAWHVGESQWQGRTWLNATSIGIELVNPGYQDGPTGRRWFAYPDEQIDALITLLKDISQRQGIKPMHILGHSDVAPQRKVDPGPLFPWKRLADAGLIPWPKAAEVARQERLLQGLLPNAAWFQQQLARQGYAVPSTGQFDEETRKVISAFQMRYRPEKIDGQADIQTAALLLAMAN